MRFTEGVSGNKRFLFILKQNSIATSLFKRWDFIIPSCDPKKSESLGIIEIELKQWCNIQVVHEAASIAQTCLGRNLHIYVPPLASVVPYGPYS